MGIRDKIDKVLGNAEKNVMDYVEKRVNSELAQKASSSTDTAMAKSDKVNASDALAKAAQSAQVQTEKQIKEEQAALDKQINNFDTGKAARKVVDDALNKMIDDAVKAAKNDKSSKNQAELDQQIKEIVRGHKNAAFNSNRLLTATVADTKKQLDSIIDKQVKELVDTKMMEQALRPLNVDIHQNIDLKLNAELKKLIRIDVTKSLNNAIGGILKDPNKDVSKALNQLHLDSLNKVLNSQVAALQGNLAKSITKGMSSNIAAEQKRVAAVQKQIVEVQKQVQAFEQKLKDQVKALQEKVNTELKKVEKQLVDEIKKSVKIKM